MSGLRRKSNGFNCGGNPYKLGYDRFTNSRNSANSGVESCGPGDASG
jgi:hypothetical protein